MRTQFRSVNHNFRSADEGAAGVSDACIQDSDRGSSAVEFALVVPLLLLLLFGIIDYGIVFSQQSTLNSAVREGARRSVINDPYTGAGSSPRTCDGIIRSIKNQLSGLALDSSQVAVKVTHNWPGNSCGTTFQTTTFGASSGSQPCLGSFDTANNTAGSLVVEVRSVATLPASIPPLPASITLTSKAVYRCEFSF